MCASTAPAEIVVAFVLVGAVAAALFFAKPLFAAMGNYTLVVFFVLLVGAAVLSGIPIAFAFGLGTFSYLALTTRTPLTVVVSRMDEGMSHLILLSVPLFVFLGLLIEMTGMAQAMVEFLATLLGHVRGGPVLCAAGRDVPRFRHLRRQGRRHGRGRAGAVPGDETARRASRASWSRCWRRPARMTETIPPSLVLITIGSVTGVSIAALFTGGLLPASGAGARSSAPSSCWRSGDDDLAGIKRATWRRSARASRRVAGACAAVPDSHGRGRGRRDRDGGVDDRHRLRRDLGVVLFRQFDWRRLWPMLVDTASLSGAILFIVGTATAMAWALTQSGFSRQLAPTWRVPGGGVGFMAFTIVVFIVLGCVLEGIPALVLFGPLLFPMAKPVGIHEVHYAMVVILAMGIGLFAPPFGVGYYAACAIGRVDPAKGIKPIVPYLLALFAGTLLIAAVPWLSVGFLRN